jgi:hypothetical protein
LTCNREGFVFTFDEIIPMSLPQKQKGFRKIVIDGKEFYDPRIVTPSFVRKAIEFALRHNWDIAANTGITTVAYRDNQFNIVLQS